MRANRERISFARKNLNKKVNDVTVVTNVNGVQKVRFVQLADVPDKVWKKVKSDKVKYGRYGPENPNHYADIDLAMNGQKSLSQLTPTAASLVAQSWRDYYDAIGFTQVRERGLLPFRVWQIYKKMVEFVANKQPAEFLTAAGILAHYVGDACQPLHGSYLDDGDPFRNPDGSKSSTMLPHSHGYAAGVHAAYEDDMLDDKVGDLLLDLDKTLAASQPMTVIHGGQAAGFATVELMRRTSQTLAPIDIVNAYGALGLAPITNAAQKHAAASQLWTKFRAGTVTVIADGGRTLAMLWDSAWKEGQGKNISTNELVEFTPSKLRSIYEKQTFLKSVPLDDIDAQL